MTFAQRRLWVETLRRLPLTSVLQAVGAEADRQDPAKWQTVRGLLSVNGTKFMNWSQGLGGGGAIDLAMHLTASDFTAAIEWLARLFPYSGPPPRNPVTTPPRPTPCFPPSDPDRLCRVKSYLIQQRRLPVAMTDPLIQSGRLYADSRANAVFLMLGNNRRPVGAELRGTTATPWRGLAPGSRKDIGYFSVGPPNASYAVLCESAIDAISCAALHPDHLCLSTAGARPNPAWITDLLNQGSRLYCGFDADPTGDNMARSMIAIHPTIQRLRPPLHDWNDVLKASL